MLVITIYAISRRPHSQRVLWRKAGAIPGQQRLAANRSRVETSQKPPHPSVEATEEETLADVCCESDKLEAGAAS